MGHRLRRSRQGPNLPSLPVMALLFLCCIVAIKGLRLPEVYAEINGQAGVCEIKVRASFLGSRRHLGGPKPS